MDLALKSAADFMEDRKHILDRWKETFNQSPALLFLGKVYRGKKSIQGVKCFFVSLNWILYLLKATVLGYQ